MNLKITLIKAILLITNHGVDLMNSSCLQQEKLFIQHGNTNCLEHSVFVAYVSALMVVLLRLKVNECSLIRGALLHDYFLYDWHIKNSHTGLHGFSHAQTALVNAEQDFQLNIIEKEIIRCHMFPLNLRIPRYKESWIVIFADKFCALFEILFGRVPTIIPTIMKKGNYYEVI